MIVKTSANLMAISYQLSTLTGEGTLIVFEVDLTLVQNLLRLYEELVKESS